jgi:hypothetical protein
MREPDRYVGQPFHKRRFSRRGVRALSPVVGSSVAAPVEAMVARTKAELGAVTIW